MRVIQKKISLETLTSRLPGVVPAYRERDGKTYTFDDEALKKRENAFPSNYGMIPKFVETEQFGCLSWERISDWYHFFTDYYHLLNDWGHCGIKYTAATEYYAYESKNGYADQMIYGTEKYKYQELDDLFAERGGETMYNYICENLVPSVDIPSEYKDYWHVSKLFYPDIVKWKAWFTPRAALYGDIELADCKGKEDCCDCTEYVNRGGKTMSDLLNTIYNGIQGRIKALKTCEPYMMTDVSLQVSLDDLGEFSIFSKDYELGVDYRVASGYGATENTEYGTVVAIDGKAMKLTSGSGFTFDPKFMEKIYDDKAWVHNSGDAIIENDITWKCENCGHIWFDDTTPTKCPKCESEDIHKIAEEDVYTRYYQLEGRPTGYYGFNQNNERIVGSSETYVRDSIEEKYPVETLNVMYIDDILYNIESEEFGYYNNDPDRMYFVYREEYTQTPFTSINGKKIYGDAKPQSVDKYFYFPFFTTGEKGKDVTQRGDCGRLVFNGDKYKWFPRQRGDDTELKEFITYEGTTILLENVVNGTRLRGRFLTPDGLFYVGADKVENVYPVYTVDEDNWLEATDEYVYDEATNTAEKVSDKNTFIPVYNMSCITGKSASKLYELRVNNMLTDDTGEVIPGRYDVSGRTNQQPSEGDVLDLIYEVGNTNRIVPFSGAGENFYFGDIITSMKFFYKYRQGDICEESVVKVSIDDNNSIKTSLSAINESTSAITAIIASEDNNMLFEPDIYCEIEYLIGTTLSGQTKTETKDGVELVVGTKYGVADTSSGYSNGVHYTEVVKFVKTEYQYKLSTAIPGQIPMTVNKPTSHKLCYPVICYMLKQEETDIVSFFGNKYSYALADFKMCFPPYSGWTGYEELLEIFPVFRQEYMMGSATKQNIDVDIYIDRGINAAYEKHLKLGEVTSMEALQQYTNGYFKMIEN
jgi:hypothetical protein